MSNENMVYNFAANQGENLSDNPYEKTMWTHNEWVEGYNEFKK